MTWEEIVVEFNAWQSMRCKPVNLQKYKEGTVIDEDRSVRWNREEVACRNAAYQDAVAVLNTARNKARDKAYAHIFEYIKDELGVNCTQKKAEALWNYAYDAGHSYGLDEIKIHLDSLMDLADVLMGKE